ncbi:MAG: hypothetical protein ACUVV5_00260 [Candidatus Aminicenantales bacterium]
MADQPTSEPKIQVHEIIVEALKGIKNEILLFAVVVAALFVGSATLGLEVLKEIKWPLLFIFSLGLIAYFVARAIPQAKIRLKQRLKQG